MKLVESAHRKIMATADDAARELYVRALRSSVIWEGLGDGLAPTSAEDVVAMTGVDPAVLEANFILLSKQVLAEYAAELGAPHSLSSIRKKLTASSYEKMFPNKRNAVRNGKKLLLTYAEARMYLGVRSKGQMPS